MSKNLWGYRRVKSNFDTKAIDSFIHDKKEYKVNQDNNTNFNFQSTSNLAINSSNIFLKNSTNS